MPGELSALEGLISQMGNTDPATPPVQKEPTAEPQPSTTLTSTQPTTEPPKDGDPTPAANPEPTTDPEPDYSELFSGGKGKANAAFAQMRTRNRTLEGAFTQLGQALGIQGQDTEAIVAEVQRRVVALQAQQYNVPPEFLQQSLTNEQRLAQMEEDRMKGEALAGFQRVKTEFGLTNKQLEEFASKLVADGKNPFQTPVDLTREYKSIYYDALQEKKIKEAVDAALERERKAHEQSSKPLTPTGAPSGAEPKAVNSVGALNDLLKGMSR